MSAAVDLMRDFEDSDEEPQIDEGLGGLGGDQDHIHNQEQGLKQDLDHDQDYDMGQGLEHDFEQGVDQDMDRDEAAQQEEAKEPAKGSAFHDGNNFEQSVSIIDQLTEQHKILRDYYSIKFPELENLVTNAVTYAQVAAIIKNADLEDIKSIADSSDNMIGVPLKKILGGATLMVVAIEGTTSKGRNLTEAELKVVLETCEKILALDRARTALTENIEEGVFDLAPNLATLIGPHTAAQFLNQSGGLRKLSQIPACNLGAQGASRRQEGLGLATNHGVRSQGFLYESDFIHQVPLHLKKQAIRIVSAKMVLAARADVSKYATDGSLGEDLKQQCQKRIDKLQEAAPNSGIKALPAPDDKPSRKRGGRRARAAKDAVAMTELRKAQNRMAFGKEETEVGFGTGDSTIGMGMLGQQSDGRIRGIQIDQRTRAKLSKNNKGWGANTPVDTAAATFGSLGQTGTVSTLQARGLRVAGVNGPLPGTSTGTASSVGSNGLDVIDPKVQAELTRKRKAEERRWFNSGTFTGGGQSSMEPGKEKDGFKVPALPPRKRLDTGKGKMDPPAKP
ncbi:Pre-mRNA-processing factor 31 [Penicillium chermesinum]|uniref:Pre-mRNA-processing factor 31 n=1 Tax=Penicillium chermesinum TaxID=63820 RepID=A0A9W9TZ16_9EURO|nr:Pre-mRNA-processing factor 31 [Penicillium chermesinum]KAJ5246879.1 Pre-mRNA-processing factor 31 [Penicillium chermesinum]